MGRVEFGGGRAIADFDALYAAERLPMMRMAYLVVGSNDIAEDIVQDCFAELLVRWDTIDRHGAYLRRSVLNRCMTSKRRTRVELAHRSVRRAESTADPDEGLVDCVGPAAAGAARAVVCTYYLDMNSQDAAAALGTEPATVRTWVRRGLTTVRKELA